MENKEYRTQEKHSDRYDRKIQCPYCRARLMDVTDPTLEYDTVSINNNTSGFAFKVKCARCKTMVGVFLRQSVA